MYAVYLTYGRPTTVYGDLSTHVIEAGEERHLITTVSLVHANEVVASWLKDPDTISVRVERR